MHRFILSVLVLFSLTAQAQHLTPGNPGNGGYPSNPNPGNGSGYGNYGNLSQYYQAEQDAIYFNNLYNRAPSGSWEEQNAKQNRDRAIQNAVSIVSSSYTFSGMQYTEIERFSLEANTKYNQASSGSALERMYQQTRDYALNALTNEYQRVIQYTQNSEQLIRFGNELRQKYNQASSGSALERAYKQGYTRAFQQLPQVVSMENNYKRDFREVEFAAINFNNLYNKASSGSLEESAYRTSSTNSFNQAIQMFQNQARYMYRNDLLNIQAEYDRKYNQASSGSTTESYYRSIRDTARSYIR